MKITNSLVAMVFAGLSLAAASMLCHADDFANTKSVKAVWDVTTGDEKTFNDRIGLIRQTADSLKKRGITSDFVLLIHGPAAKFVTKSLSGTKFEKDKLESLTKIQSTLESLTKDGMKVEVCAIAMSRGKIDKSNVQPFAVIQDNVFENSITLQNKGYAYMPVF